MRKLYIIRNNYRTQDKLEQTNQHLKVLTYQLRENKFRNYYKMEGVFCVLTCLTGLKQPNTGKDKDYEGETGHMHAKVLIPATTSLSWWVS